MRVNNNSQTAKPEDAVFAESVHHKQQSQDSRYLEEYSEILFDLFFSLMNLHGQLPLLSHSS